MSVINKDEIGMLGFEIGFLEVWVGLGMFLLSFGLCGGECLFCF